MASKPIKDGKDLGLVEFCERCETVELLDGNGARRSALLIWLLDYLRSSATAAVAKMVLCLVDRIHGDDLAEGTRPMEVACSSTSRTIISTIASFALEGLPGCDATGIWFNLDAATI